MESYRMGPPYKVGEIMVVPHGPHAYSFRVDEVDDKGHPVKTKLIDDNGATAWMKEQAEKGIHVPGLVLHRCTCAECVRLRGY